ncbi:hypothetical protein SDC9_163274 [bioreactor metagenome]|uniref:Uncharacterized protein n=1 Tax=bioreactor metagenome TaxID=1076179 RepID=A0A645FND3_9ZZZZ
MKAYSSTAQHQPGLIDLHLHIGVRSVELAEQPDGEPKGDERGDERCPAQSGFGLWLDAQNDQNAQNGEEGDPEEWIHGNIHILPLI